MSEQKDDVQFASRDIQCLLHPCWEYIIGSVGNTVDSQQWNPLSFRAETLHILTENVLGFFFKAIWLPPNAC